MKRLPQIFDVCAVALVCASLVGLPACRQRESIESATYKAITLYVIRRVQKERPDRGIVIALTPEYMSYIRELIIEIGAQKDVVLWCGWPSEYLHIGISPPDSSRTAEKVRQDAVEKGLSEVAQSFIGKNKVLVLHPSVGTPPNLSELVTKYNKQLEFVAFASNGPGVPFPEPNVHRMRKLVEADMILFYYVAQSSEDKRAYQPDWRRILHCDDFGKLPNDFLEDFFNCFYQEIDLSDSE